MIRVIYNPAAGPKLVRKIDRLKAVLDGGGIPFEILSTTGPGDAVLLAREAAGAGADAVVAVGGDGTLNETANGLAGSRTRLLLIPHGTGNVFAREVGLPGSVEEAVKLLSDGKTVEIPLARAADRYFVLLASAGFDAEVVERMVSRQKNLLGRSAYVLSGIRHLLRPQPPLWMEFPGRERKEAQVVLVCRGKTYAGVPMAPAADLLGDSFQVVALLSPGRWGIVRFTLSVLLKRHLRSARVLVREARTLLVRSRIPSAAQVDGEFLGPLPVRFEMTDVRIRVVVPREYSGSASRD
jgi:YegS/Rv2252/BmrU family lipid kinase